MNLSCSCSFDKDDLVPGELYYYYPSDFTTLKARRRKRCVSCKTLIEINSIVIEFENFRHPTDEIEMRCKGDEIRMASTFMCEKCGEIFLNLTALEFCVDIHSSSMAECLSEYHEMTGFKRAEKSA